LAGILFVSAILLLYSAVVVPFQICMWDYSNPCNIFPTLRFDMFVDVFFMVPDVVPLHRHNSNHCDYELQRLLLRL
jgi:hypothetical protein